MVDNKRKPLQLEQRFRNTINSPHMAWIAYNSDSEGFNGYNWNIFKVMKIMVNQNNNTNWFNTRYMDSIVQQQTIFAFKIYFISYGLERNILKTILTQAKINQIKNKYKP